MLLTFGGETMSDVGSASALTSNLTVKPVGESDSGNRTRYLAIWF